MSEYNGQLVPFAEGVWTATIPASILGMKLSATMTILRLADGRLLVYSPVKMDESGYESVRQIGQVAHLYAPNLFHHTYLKEWAALFPEARVHGPHGLEKKCPGVEVHRYHGTSDEPAFAGTVKEFVVEGCRLKESVLLYEPAGTLLVADLVHNVGQPEGSWTKFYTKAMGFYDQVALSRMIRWTAFDDRKAARASVQAILSHPFERLIVGHGVPLLEGANATLSEAYTWLCSE
jgi:hypothetical protein